MFYVALLLKFADWQVVVNVALVNRTVFNRSNGLMIKCLIECLMN